MIDPSRVIHKGAVGLGHSFAVAQKGLASIQKFGEYLVA
jgi:hypothetical protein